MLIEDILIYGALSGAAYALLALGFTLIYGVAKVVNMTHGPLFMLGAYMFSAFVTSLGYHPIENPSASLLPPAIIFAVIFVAIAGIIIYRLFIHSIIENVLAVMVTTIGAALIIQQLIINTFGGRDIIVPSLMPGSFKFLGVTVTYSRFLAAVVSLGLFVGLWIFITKSKIGGAMRAAAQDREVAMLMGINTMKIYVLTMAISASLAAIAGIVITASTTRVAYQLMWFHPLALSFAIVILGGLGSIKGAFIGAFIVGYAETAVSFALPEGSFLKGAVALAIMVVVLVLRPKGLFGKRIELE